MTSLTVLPPFTGKTYDDLLADVAARIAEEPARLDMRWWVLLKDGKRPSFTPRSLEALARPACGTVACLGGWMDLRSGLALHDHLTNGEIAVGLVSRFKWNELFRAFVNDGQRHVDISDSDYTSLVLDRLAAFRRAHAESLKTPLPKSLDPAEVKA